MKDIPLFTTEFGVASLILKEIPYRQEAYVRLRATENPADLIKECVGFCRACGAERIFATGHEFLEGYPLHTTVLQMQCSADSLSQTDAALFPVLPENLEHWRSIYNEKMAAVPNASYMTEKDGKAMLHSGSGYFVHRDGKLLGIGKVSGNKIEAVAAVVPGGGKDVTLALCSLIQDDTVSLEVASANMRAIRLYEKLGFLTVNELSKWYLLFPSG